MKIFEIMREKLLKACVCVVLCCGVNVQNLLVIRILHLQ